MARSDRQTWPTVISAPIPTRIGPAEFAMLGGMIAVWYPAELAPLLPRAGATWEPGSRRCGWCSPGGLGRSSALCGPPRTRCPRNQTRTLGQ